MFITFTLPGVTEIIQAQIQAYGGAPEGQPTVELPMPWSLLVMASRWSHLSQLNGRFSLPKSC